MKVFVLLFVLLFSYSIIADGCVSEDLAGSCQVELTQSDACHDSHAKTSTQEACHCAFSCSPKILATQTYDLVSVSYTFNPEFPNYIEVFKTLDPLPVLQPPIV